MHISKSLFVFVYLKLLVLQSIFFVYKSLLILVLLGVGYYYIYNFFEAAYRVDKYEAWNELGQHKVRY